MKKTTSLLLFILVLLPVSGFAYVNGNVKIAELHRELSHTGSRKDPIKILYDISDLSQTSDYVRICGEIAGVAARAGNAELASENKSGQIDDTRRIMVFVIVGWMAFAVMLMALLFFWTRYKRTTAGIFSFVDTLIAERDSIKKRRYYDYAKEIGDSKYQDSYRSVRPKVESISETVDYIINDIMFISSVALEDSRKYRQNVSVRKFMGDSISGVEAELDRDIKVNVIYPETDFEINVDKECLEMLTNHILKVAVRLAPEGGSIGLECTEEKSTRMARFVFKHSGESLPEGKEEKIFEQFFHYKALSETGEGALIMVRMINFLTNCSLRSSAGHTIGGKLVLMVPMQ